MATQANEVYGGMNGYIPIKSDSHGGIDLGHALNGLIVYKLLEKPKEYGYVQVDARIIQDSAAKGETVNVSPNGQYWVEEDGHLRPVETPPPPDNLVGTYKLEMTVTVTKIA